MKSKNIGLKNLILPGLIFQSLVISGGYGTGAELSQFFYPYGPAGGLLGLCLVTFGVWALVCAVSFEFSRTFKTYNYMTFFKKLLGKGWVLYELCYFIMLLLVLAVLSASAGLNFSHMFGVPGWVGKLLVSAFIIALVLGGTSAVEKFLSYWSYVLYAVYIIFLIVCFTRFGDNIARHFAISPQVNQGWMLGGAKYAFYNLGMIPAVLFSTRHASARKHAVLSGIIAAAIAVIPAILLFVAMTGLYPQIAGVEAPVNAIFSALQTPMLQYLFQIVLFGTLVETGAGMIKAVSDRFESGFEAKGQGAPYWVRPLVCAICMSLGIGISTLGLTQLIENGYGSISWGFLAVFVVPMLTIGVVKIAKAKGRRA